MQEIISLNISSRLENIAKVESLIDNLREHYQLDEKQYANILLASVEAVTNAIEHGNNLDERKEVRIEAFRSDGTFRLFVKDQGCGFNPDKLPDPTSPECREQPDGRGVFLMRQLADVVSFRDGGTCVEMQFFLS